MNELNSHSSSLQFKADDTVKNENGCMSESVFVDILTHGNMQVKD